MTNKLRDESTIYTDANHGHNAEPGSRTDNCKPKTDNFSTPGPTGPRTPQGKAVSAQNALKLGLSIQRHVVLPHEDAAEYDELRRSILAIYEPQSARETLAIDDIAQCRWAFRRFDEAENTALAKSTETWVRDEDPVTVGQGLGYLAEPLDFIPNSPQDEDWSKPRIQVSDSCWAGFQHLHRYRTWWERKHQRALAEYERARQSRRQDTLDHQRAEWHEARMADAQRKQKREQAAERRREAIHTLRLSREQQKLAQQQARTRQAEAAATLREAETQQPDTAPPAKSQKPSHPTPEFVSQNGQNRGELVWASATGPVPPTGTIVK